MHLCPLFTAMSVNSSSTTTTVPPFPSLEKMHSVLHNCINCTTGTFNITTYNITSVLLILPICLFVLCLGLQRRRHPRHSMAISHTDFFTYHIVAVELTCIMGFSLICGGSYANVPLMSTVGIYLFHATVCGQVSFHMLTSMERYLAVVHPVTYLNLKKAKGIIVRNITTSCTWLSCIAMLGVLSIEGRIPTVIVLLFSTVIPLAVVSFCSLSVLCVLIRPGPGEGVGCRRQMDQSKLKAFHTIVAILGVLMIRFGGIMVMITLYALSQMGEMGICIVWWSAVWFGLPSTLVLPVLFLQRAGKLPRCNK